MKHDIIKTKDYLLVVDDSEIKESDWYYYENGKTLKGVEQVVNGKITKTMVSKKIISHLPLNGSPILQGVDLLPPLPLEDDGVEKLADKYANQFMDGRDAYYGYKEGYNQAKEKYKYTEEDIDKAYWAGMQFVGEDKGSYKEFIQSLSQPKMPIGFECVTETRVFDTYPEKRNINPKTTTTSEGHKEWMGTYIYE